VIRDDLGSYDPMWFGAAGLCMGAAVLARLIRIRHRALASPAHR
jgi:hypothetical protein